MLGSYQKKLFQNKTRNAHSVFPSHHRSTHHEFSTPRPPTLTIQKVLLLIETLDEFVQEWEKLMTKFLCTVFLETGFLARKIKQAKFGHNRRSGDTLPPGSGLRLCWMGEIKTEVCHLERLVWVTSINSNRKNLWMSLQGITRVLLSTRLLKLKQISSTWCFAQQEKHLATRHPPKHSISRIILQSPQLHHRITHHNPYKTPSSKRLCSAAKRCDSKASFSKKMLSWSCWLLGPSYKNSKDSCQIGDPAGYLGIPTFFQFSQQVDKTSCKGNSFNLTLCSELWSGKPSKWPDKKIKSLSKKGEN